MEGKYCEIWRQGQSCPHAQIELFNNENGQLEMISQFDIHIFPWGNIGELGYTSDFHFIWKVHTPLRFHLNLWKRTWSDKTELNSQPNYVFTSKTLPIEWFTFIQTNITNKYHSDRVRDKNS